MTGRVPARSPSSRTPAAVPGQRAPGLARQNRTMARHFPRPDRDAGGALDVLAAKAALREEVWSGLTAAHVARFPGAAGRIPNFTGAEAAAERLRERPEWRRAARLSHHLRLR